MAEEPPRPQPPPLYSSAAGEAQLRRLYDDTLAALPFAHEERWLSTPSFGRVHVVVAGPEGAPPLVLWHGTAAPAPYMLLAVEPLVARFRIYCPDIPCQAGSRSDPAVLDPGSHGHGRWCAEVVEGLGLLGSGADASSAAPGGAPAGQLRLPVHVGISLGGAMLLDLAVVKPDAIGAAVLLCPGSLHPDFGRHGMPLSLAIGFAMYRYLPCTPTAYLALAPMCDEPLAGDPTLKNVLLGIRHCSYFPEGPRTFVDEQLRRLAAPTLLIASERDVFGPGRAAVERARSVWPASQLEAELNLGSKHVPSSRGMAWANDRMLCFFADRGLAGAA